MHYHVLLDIAGTQHWWANYDFTRIVQETIIPYINKQVVAVNYQGSRAILNLGTASYIRIFKTQKQS